MSERDIALMAIELRERLVHLVAPFHQLDTAGTVKAVEKLAEYVETGRTNGDKTEQVAIALAKDDVIRPVTSDRDWRWDADVPRSDKEVWRRKARVAIEAYCAHGEGEGNAA